jgi:hypothetical protein
MAKLSSIVSEAQNLLSKKSVLDVAYGPCGDLHIHDRAWIVPACDRLLRDQRLAEAWNILTRNLGHAHSCHGDRAAKS